MKTLLLGLVGACRLVLWWSEAWAWQTTTTGTATSRSPDVARAVTVDAMGDVVAAGSTRNIDTDVDFTVVKLRGTDGETSDHTGRSPRPGAAGAAVPVAGDVVASAQPYCDLPLNTPWGPARATLFLDVATHPAH